MMRSFPRAAALPLLALAAGLLALAPCRAETFSIDIPRDGRQDGAEVRFSDGEPYFLLSDVSRAVAVSRHWNPDTGKMSLAVGPHIVSVSEDNAFVSFDGEVRNVLHPVLSLEGELWVPSTFLTGPLAEALNAEIRVSPQSENVMITKLGAKILGLYVEPRDGASALVVSTNDRTPFAVRSRSRGRIDLFLPAATVPDSLMIDEPNGLVSSVATEQNEDGVRLTVRVAPSATSYEAEMRSDPYRLEIIVFAVRRDAIPSPLLRGPKQLLSKGTGPFATPESPIETVMLDPGHGGSDLGHVGPNGLAEKDAALALAEATSRYLQREGFYVFMTRSADSDVPIKRRAEIANLSGADMFVSIHCGSWYSGGATGFRVAYYEPTGETFADSDGSSGGLRRVSAGVSLAAASPLAWGKAQESVAEESSDLARAIHSRLAESLDSRDRGVGGEDEAVLAGCSMPAVLVEPAFISNPYEAASLDDGSFVNRVALAIAKGVADHRDAMARRNK
jgi:N-acetylmuramoyl-L-alanine amidase